MIDFTVDDLLCMDYRALRSYMEQAVLLKPSLGMKMRMVQLNNTDEDIDENPSKKAKIRCVSAFLGFADPYPVKQSVKKPNIKLVEEA